MKRLVDVLYGLKGYPNASRFTDFKTDLFANGSTPAIVMDTASTTGITISAACTTGILISGATTTGISITGTSGSACIDFGPASVTTGSLIDYTAIVGKVSGYLFNGSMTTSTLTASTLIDDFSCACAHDGAAADTLRMIRRIWSGALPNGTAAADFKMVELSCTSTIGTAASKTGTATGLKVDFGSATVNDASLTLYGIYVDTTVTNTTSTAIHGIYVTSAQYGLTIGDGMGSGSSAIYIEDASDLTNLFKFNEAAGCILNVDVSPTDTPSDGGLGADACIRIDVNGADYFIPLFAVELS